MFIVTRIIYNLYRRLCRVLDWYYSHLIINPLVSLPIITFLLISTCISVIFGNSPIFYIALLAIYSTIFIFKSDVYRLIIFISISISLSFLPLYRTYLNLEKQEIEGIGVVEGGEYGRELEVEIGNRVRQKNTYQNAWGKVDGEVNVYLQLPRYPEVRRGSNCTVHGDVDIADLSTGFGEYLKKNSTFLFMKVTSFECDEQKVGGMYRLYDIKDVAIFQIERYINEPNASLLIGMMFGDDRVYTEDFQEKIRATGLSHIVAASGYNIVFVQGAIEKVLFPFNIRKRKVISIILLVMYCFIAGNTGSILRAMYSNVIGVFARLTGFPLPAIFNLLLVGMLMLLIKPLYIYDIGFQLSFLATFGILVIVPALKRVVSVYESLLIPFVCSVVVMPISISNFGGVSIISTFTNFFALGSLSYIMPSGFIFVFLSLVYENISPLLASIVDLQFIILNIVVEKMGGIGFAVVNIGYVLPVIAMFSLLAVTTVVIYRSSTHVLK